jgi:hypothetical protein
MTDKPKTLSLNTRQWRVLLADNLDVLKGQVVGTELINEDNLKQIHAQLDDMKMLAVAWFQVGVPATEAAKKLNVPDGPVFDAAPPQTNSVSAPKRRGRRTNAERAAMAQQGAVQ